MFWRHFIILRCGCGHQGTELVLTSPSVLGVFHHSSHLRTRQPVKSVRTFRDAQSAGATNQAGRQTQMKEHLGFFLLIIVKLFTAPGEYSLAILVSACAIELYGDVFSSRMDEMTVRTLSMMRSGKEVCSRVPPGPCRNHERTLFKNFLVERTGH